MCDRARRRGVTVNANNCNLLLHGAQSVLHSGQRVFNLALGQGNRRTTEERFGFCHFGFWGIYWAKLKTVETKRIISMDLYLRIFETQVLKCSEIDDMKASVSFFNV